MSGSPVNDNNNNLGNYKNVTHVIFDLDGLLIDSERIYENIISDIAKSYGKEYRPETRMRVLGTVERKSAEIVVRECELPISIDEYIKIYKKLSLERLCDVNFMKGAEKLIHHLHDKKVPFCLATSSGEQMVQRKTGYREDIMNLFHHKVCGSTDQEVKNGKPAPDIFLIAAKRFGDSAPKPEQCLVFEDSPNGVTAAVAAGMQVVMVPDPRAPAELKKSATIVLDSLEDFKPELFGLPKF